jgi:aspartyl-tRNA(Asn)/glutamyl-tRNA(Gln) amidotransferase subunit C
MNKKSLLSRQDVVHIAKLANLVLSEAEIDKFQKQLSQIVDFVGKIQGAPLEKVVAKKEKMNIDDVTRKDLPAPSLKEEEVLQNASQKENNFFKVKAIFDDS